MLRYFTVETRVLSSVFLGVCTCQNFFACASVSCNSTLNYDMTLLKKANKTMPFDSTSRSLHMKWHWPTLEQVRWVFPLNVLSLLAESDEPNPHPGLENVRRKSDVSAADNVRFSRNVLSLMHFSSGIRNPLNWNIRHV